MLEGLLQRTSSPQRRAAYEAELALPDFPIPLAYLWGAYHRIRRRKGGAGMGVSPIEWPDIDAFIRRARMPLLPWEIETIERLDDAYLAHAVSTLDGK